MSPPQFVPDVHHPGDALARLFHPEKVAQDVAQGQCAIVLAMQRDLRHRRFEHSRTDRMTLSVIRVEQAFR